MDSTVDERMMDNDGWMDGTVDRCMGGWMDGWMDR